MNIPFRNFAGLHTTRPVQRVAVIGAGPVGLAAAAHLIGRGIEPIVFEQGHEVGHAVRHWAHVRLFSPWEFNIDDAAVRLLAGTGWTSPDPDRYPTGAEFLRDYLLPLAKTTPIARAIKTHSRVIGVSWTCSHKVYPLNRDYGAFAVRYRNGKEVRTLLVDAVIDAGGTWWNPNSAGCDGRAADGEQEFASRIAYGMPDVLAKDRNRYQGRRVAVLGAGHSAIGTLFDLDTLARQVPETSVTWIVREVFLSKSFVHDADAAVAARSDVRGAATAIASAGRIAIRTGFCECSIACAGDKLIIQADASSRNEPVVVDELIIATGFRPDLSYLSGLRRTANRSSPRPNPLNDPGEFGCPTCAACDARELASWEQGLYIVGMKSSWRAPTFLLQTGYEQVRAVATDLAGFRVATVKTIKAKPNGVIDRQACNGAALRGWGG